MAKRSGNGGSRGRQGSNRGGNRRGGGGGRERSPEDNGLEKLGALWLGQSQQGIKYMSGEIDGVGRVVVFKNGFKEQDKHPDYVVYLSRDRERSSGGGGGKRSNRKQEQEQEEALPDSAPVGENDEAEDQIGEDDIPF